MTSIKSLNNKMSVNGLNDLNALNTMHFEFFVRHDYDWWYEVQPGDIVMDVGSNIGMFTCHALDKGARHVYAIEPNISLTETLFKNALPHIVNKKVPPVSFINAAIAEDMDHVTHVHGEFDKNEIKLKRFSDIIREYEIDFIDYLKIDCEGGEYDILSEENFDFIKNRVKHIAVEVHLDFHKDGIAKYMKFRDTFLSRFDRSKIKFLGDQQQEYEMTFERNWLDVEWPVKNHSCWMIYICNHDVRK